MESRGPRLLQTRFSQPIPATTPSRMVVQSSIDEEKLNSIKQNVQKRPTYRQSYELPKIHSSALNVGSTDDTDSVFARSPNLAARVPISNNHIDSNDKSPRDTGSTRRLDSSSTMQSERDYYSGRNKASIDCASVTSSEWGGESERGEPSIRESNTTKKRKFLPMIIDFILTHNYLFIRRIET